MRKKIAVIGSITIVFLALISTVYYFNKSEYKKLNIPLAGQEMPNVNYQFEASSDNLPIESTVYKFSELSVDNDSQKIANKLGFFAKPELNDIGYEFKNNEEKLQYHNSTGHWTYQTTNKPSNYHTGVNIPSEDESKNIAIKFLKEYDLLPDRFNKIIVTDRSSGDKTTNDFRITGREVYFYPTINNLPVYGISRIIVEVGDNGKVISVNKIYKDFIEYKKVKLKDLTLAFEDVKNNKGSNNISPKAQKAKIKKVELGYWEDAGTIKDQPYIQPVWVFSGEATLDDNKIEKFDVFVPAIE